MHIIQAISARTHGQVKSDFSESQIGFMSQQVAIGGAVGDLCWSSERDTSMPALMRELFYFKHQTQPVPENAYMATRSVPPRRPSIEFTIVHFSGFVIAGDKVQAASVLLPRRVKGEKKVAMGCWWLL
jgi:hypothetical protein